MPRVTRGRAAEKEENLRGRKEAIRDSLVGRNGLAVVVGNAARNVINKQYKAEVNNERLQEVVTQCHARRVSKQGFLEGDPLKGPLRDVLDAIFAHIEQSKRKPKFIVMPARFAIQLEGTLANFDDWGKRMREGKPPKIAGIDVLFSEGTTAVLCSG